MKIKCSCGKCLPNRKPCPKGLSFHDNQVTFYVDYFPGGSDRVVATSMYVDANTLVQIVKEARKALIELTNDAR